MWIQALFIGLLAGLFPAAANACVSVLPISGTTIQYDPTASAPTLRQIQFQIIEQCNDNPNDTVPVRLFFSDDIEPQPFAEVGGVPFDIVRQARSLLQTPIQPLQAPLTVPVRGTATVQIDLVLSPGIVAVNGNRQLTVNFTTPSTGPDTEVRSQLFTIELQALPVLSLRLADGRQNARLDFGVLQAGAVRSTILETQASVPYSVTFESTYDEMMRMADPCGVPLPATDDPRLSISYRALLDGQVINERV
ncbi:MAG: hypothetical protein WBN07_14895, partial [Woeseiaceae bacterium]